MVDELRNPSPRSSCVHNFPQQKSIMDSLDKHYCSYMLMIN